MFLRWKRLKSSDKQWICDVYMNNIMSERGLEGRVGLIKHGIYVKWKRRKKSSEGSSQIKRERGWKSSESKVSAWMVWKLVKEWKEGTVFFPFHMLFIA